MLLAALLAGCSGSRTPGGHPTPLPPFAEPGLPARAHRLDEAGRLRLTGPFAEAAPGDFLLENGRTAVAIAGLAAPTPGAVLDAGRPGGPDSLRALQPVVGVEPAAPRFERAELEHLGGAATLRLYGVDPAAPSVQVVSEYSLHPGVGGLRLITTVRNQGSEVRRQYKLGDRVDWGSAEVFAPGLGRTLSGQPLLDWVGAFSAETSHLYFRTSPVAADLSRAGATGVTPLLLDTVELSPGGEASVSRQLSLGAGGQLATLLPSVLAARGIPTGAIEIAVVTDEGEPLRGATVEVRQGAGLLTLGRADGSGALRLELAAGHYLLRAGAPDRTGPVVGVEVRSGAAVPLRLPTGPPSRLLFEVHEGDAPGTVPARLVVLGLDRTPTPWLGPAHEAAAHHHLLTATGHGSLPLPPGRYRVIVTRGPEHSLVQQDLELGPYSGASLIARPRKVVDTSGFVALDPGEKTRMSAGSAVPLAVRLLAASVEGLDALAITDDAARPTTPRPRPSLLLVPGRAGQEAELGAFSLFAAQAASAGEDAGTRPDQLLQIDDARRPTGLFTRSGFDPRRPLTALVPATASALRLLDAQHPEDFDLLLADWLALLRCGRRLVGTAASGSSSIQASTAGYPRTYVEIPAGTPASAGALLQALQAGRAFVSSGPFLRLTVNGVTPGGTVSWEGVAPGGGRGRSRASAPRRRAATARELAVRVQVSAPAWIGLDELRLYWNGEPRGPAIPVAGRADGVRLDRAMTLPVEGDGFLVALVRGSSPLTPVVETPGLLHPLALTNPIWVDADGDGKVGLSCKRDAGASLPAGPGGVPPY